MSAPLMIEIWTVALTWAEVVGVLLLLGLVVLLTLPFARELAAIGRAMRRTHGARVRRSTAVMRARPLPSASPREIRLPRARHAHALARPSAPGAD